MKFLITEDQLNTIHKSLTKMLKDLGWKTTSKAVGGEVNLAKLLFNNDPINFLNMLNDLEKREYLQKSINNKLFIIQFNNNHILLIYDSHHKHLYVNDYDVYKVLKNGFLLNEKEIETLLKKWFKFNYDIDIKTISDVTHGIIIDNKILFNFDGKNRLV